MTLHTITLEAFTDVYVEGGKAIISTAFYLGKDSDVPVEVDIPFSAILKNFYEMNTIPSKPRSMKLHHKDSLQALIENMRKDLDKLEKMVDKTKVIE